MCTGPSREHECVSLVQDRSVPSICLVFMGSHNSSAVWKGGTCATRPSDFQEKLQLQIFVRKSQIF